MRVFLSTFLVLLSLNQSALALGRGGAAPSTPLSDGFAFEPALSYSYGLLTQSGVADISTQILNAEARIGYRYSGFNFGLSYLMGYGTGEQLGNKGDVKPTDIAGYLKYDLSMGFNIFAAYILSAKTKIQSSENPADFSGTGGRIGLSWSGLSVGTLMFEVISRSYTKYDSTALTKSINDSSTCVSLNFPLK